MKPVISNPQIDKIVLELKRIKDFKKDLIKKEEILMQTLYEHMSEYEELITADGELILTWKYCSDSQAFDSKRFQSEHKELYNSYLIVRAGARRIILK